MIEDKKLPVLIREFVPVESGSPFFSKDQTLIICQILSDSFKGFRFPVVSEKPKYHFGDAVGILADAKQAEELKSQWEEEKKPLAFFSEKFQQLRLA